MTGTDDGIPPALPVADQQWRRLAPRMLLIHPIMGLGRLLPVVLGIVVLGRSGGQGKWWVLALGGAVVVLSVVRWMTTRFRITAESIELRSGLLRRQSIVASVDRVRTVEVTSNLLHRLLGLAKVEVRTASAGSRQRLILDSLPASDALALQAELLHRRTVAQAAGHHAAGQGAGDTTAASAGPPSPHTRSDGAGPPADPRAGVEADHLLVRFDPLWIRYAPLTLSGVISAAVIAGFTVRLVHDVDADIESIGVLQQTAQALARLSIGTAIIVVAAALLLVVTLLSVAGYILAFWRFRLSRHDGGTLHITRGLFTTRSTSIEDRRLRGVELAEPLLLRWARAARLTAITTGLSRAPRDGNDDDGSTLVPPAPVTVVRAVGHQVLRDPAALSITLTRHGPAAARRRFSRIVAGIAVLIGAVTLAWKPGLPLVGPLPGHIPLASLALIPAGLLLARDRYRSLGHGLQGRYLVRRTGSLSRRTSVLHSDGIIGWNLRRSLFQRRAGLTTLTATTAAGAQHYHMIDMEQAEAVRFAEAVVPGLLRQFLVQPTG